MSYRKLIAIAICGLSLFANTQSANARAVRVDSGAWDISGSIAVDSVQSIGFDFDYFGFSASSAQIFTDGRIELTGEGESASLFVFFEPSQISGGNITWYQFGTTNANFSPAGIDAGFRVTWNVFDPLGAFLNEYQLTFLQFTANAFAIEFNYNRILVGNDDSQIGIASSLGHSFDLTASLGLGFSQYSGIGDDDVSNNCAATPSALACNNYHFNTGSFGSGVSVLPTIANGFFLQIDSNGDSVQGRYLFLSDRDNDFVSDLDEFIAGTDPFDPDSDDDGIGDALDHDPLVVNNFSPCIGAAAYTFSEVVAGNLICAANTSITVVSLAAVLTSGNLQLIAPIVIFEDGFDVLGSESLGYGLLTVISADPCPACP